MVWNAAYWGTLETRAYLDIAGEWSPVFSSLFSRATVEIRLSGLVLKVHTPIYVISTQDFLFYSITDFPAYSFPINVTVHELILHLRYIVGLALACTD
jgi:hypothetical protein